MEDEERSTKQEQNLLIIQRRQTRGPVAQRIRRLTTDQKIPGSNPGRVDFFFAFFTSFMVGCSLLRLPAAEMTVFTALIPKS